MDTLSTGVGEQALRIRDITAESAYAVEYELYPLLGLQEVLLGAQCSVRAQLPVPSLLDTPPIAAPIGTRQNCGGSIYPLSIFRALSTLPRTTWRAEGGRCRVISPQCPPADAPPCIHHKMGDNKVQRRYKYCIVQYLTHNDTKPPPPMARRMEAESLPVARQPRPPATRCTKFVQRLEHATLLRYCTLADATESQTR